MPLQVVQDALRSELPINLYAASDQEFQVLFYGVPGLTSYLNIGVVGEVRAMYAQSTYMLVVVGASVYTVATNLSTTLRGTLNTSSGKVWVEDNGIEIMLADGLHGYLYTISTGAFAKITDPDFIVPSSLTYQDGYFIVSQKDSGRLYISALRDGTSWDALDYATAESQPDNLLCVISDHRELWLFGTKTTEVWQDTGANDFPLERIQGAYLEYGIGNSATLAKLDNSLFWMSERGQVLRAVGYDPKIISTRKIEKEWEDSGSFLDAQAFTYIYRGHIFYEISSTAADKTYVFDAGTGMWHRRAYTENLTRGRANCYAKFNNKHLVGDYANGLIYELDDTNYTDNGQILKSVLTSLNQSANGNRIFYNRVWLDMAVGVGLEDGSVPYVMLRWSDDGLKTWKPEMWATSGAMGEYNTRVTWRCLGQSRDRVFEWSIADPVERTIYDVRIDGKASKS